MKKTIFWLIVIFGFSLVSFSCKKDKDSDSLDEKTVESKKFLSDISIDSVSILNFYKKYPQLNSYKNGVLDIYKNHNYNQIWFDKNGTVEFAHTLYNKYLDIEKEGLKADFPNNNDLELMFNSEEEHLDQLTSELLITNLYVYYANKVYKGLDEKVTSNIGWLLPRKQISYNSLLDTLLLHNNTSKVVEKKVLFNQYYKLQSVLKKYRDIEKNGGWNTIEVDETFKNFKLGDSANAISQIRERLFLVGDIASNSKSNIYDETLEKAIHHYQKRNGLLVTSTILPKHIEEMNVPIGERIKKIMVNMERCRWIAPDIASSKELIVVNIPSFKLQFIREGKLELESPVVVGKTMNKTVIFSGKMSYIVFSPYWNVPTSIIQKEVKPGMAKNPNYLAQHNMEWNNGRVRQKPGINNSLGLVKFIFPNSNNIYLHDTPSKSFFDKESRAYSHGCVRVGKPRDLAIAILRNDKNWTPEKIDKAMHKGIENSYVLKNKIPVYIGYFTAWVNEQGEICFFDDVYERDERLSKLLFTKN